jgi:hypothetical protein
VLVDGVPEGKDQLKDEGDPVTSAAKLILLPLQFLGEVILAFAVGSKVLGEKVKDLL